MKIAVKKVDSVMIWSGNWEKLADWYEEVFTLKLVEELDLPDDTGRLYEFKESKTMLWIGQHSEVSGQNKDPYRLMIGFEVDDVDVAHQALTKKEVEFIAEPTISPTADYRVATAKDPEGNIIQLFSFDIEKQG